MSHPISLLVLNILPLILGMLRIILGLMYFRWWMCLMVIPATIVAGFLSRHSLNPARPLLLGAGLIGVAVALILM